MPSLSLPSVLVSVLLMSGCSSGGGGGGGGEAALDISGEWEGFWGNPADEHRATASLSQAGRFITGTIALEGHQCIPSGTISLDLNATTLELVGGIDIPPTTPSNPFPEFSVGGHVLTPENFSLGFFEGAGACATNINLSRPAPAAFRWERSQTVYVFEEAETVLVIEER